MEFLILLIVGAGGGVMWFLVRESNRKLRVSEQLKLVQGLSEDHFVVALGNVSLPVARVVFNYFDRLGNGVGVNPASDLSGVYGFDGNLLEECLDDLQASLGVTSSGFVAAKRDQKEALRTVGDLALFVEAAVRRSISNACS